jgi:hypothetical protein
MERKMGDPKTGAAVAVKPSDALPGHPDTVVSEIIKQINSSVSLKKEEGDRLAEQIRSVLLDRMGTFDDMRMGRILGHAIATI